MFHCLADAVLINGSCHIVGCGFYILFGLPHSDSDSCVAEHADIVSSVAEGHRFFQLDAKMPDDFIDAFLFGIAFGCDIRKSRIPAAYFASRDGWKHFFSSSSVMKGVIWMTSLLLASSNETVGMTFTCRKS